jgi:uncharacterized protein (TIGR02145 family)
MTLKVLCFLMFNAIIAFSFSQVGIGTVTPAASAQLELASTTKGFLLPQMTTAQRNAIVNPVNGLQIFNTSTGCVNYYNVNVWSELCMIYPVGSKFCSNGATLVADVISPSTGKTWMDRNLGASQVATSATDALSYGDLYQWGRGNDGHQCRTSGTTTTLSSTNQPGHGNFILVDNSPTDWRSPQENNLWQGVNGVNNPCPSGYRLPTETEINAERLTWSSNNSAGAFASPLKFSLAGHRNPTISTNGILYEAGIYGNYWTSTISSTNSRLLNFGASMCIFAGNVRSLGFAVRCIKN